MPKLVECVPNFSEGRSRETIDKIAAAIAGVEGVKLLDVDPGAATNRTVVTFVGGPEGVLEAALRAIRTAAELIDMRQHRGEHARQGATDVCPFVPVSGVTMEECVALAHALGQRVGAELGIPVYLYEHAATRPERRSLPDIRAGEYEALAEKLKRPEWRPDYGPAAFHARAGATVIGARKFLIAYNINLDTKSKAIARDIGLCIRERGRFKRDERGERVLGPDGEPLRQPGLFKECKATGWFIAEYGCAQVTMNLTDYEVTPMHVVFDAVTKLAAERGARVTGSEIVGLVPKAAIVQAGTYYLKKQGCTTGVSEKEIVAAAVRSLGLSDVARFEPHKKIIEYQFERSGKLASMSCHDFAAELASSSPAPGGGSVAALSGALAAALCSMVAALTFEKKGTEALRPEMAEVGGRAQALLGELLAAIDADSEAFERVLAAMRLPKATAEEQAARGRAVDVANQGATEIPLSVLARTLPVLELCRAVVERGNPASLSDAAVAGFVAQASALGAFCNVLINLQGIADEGYAERTRQQAEQWLSQALAAGQAQQAMVLEKLRGALAREQ